MPADYHSLLSTIDKLYAAALEPSEWHRFLASVAALFDAENAFVCQAEKRRRPFDYIGLNQRNRDAVPLERYEMDKDRRMRAFNASCGRPVHCRMGVSDHELHASRVYQTYLKPLNIEYTMLVALPTRPGYTHDLGLMRGPSGKPFESDDCDLLNELVPHLARSFAVRRAIAEARSPAPAIAAAPAPREPDAESLRQRFALSPTQARLALLIAHGRTVKEASALLGTTEGTTRQYLRRIFDKTGVRRQSDLVRIVGQMTGA